MAQRQFFAPAQMWISNASPPSAHKQAGGPDI
jgi:hypothetical protein